MSYLIFDTSINNPNQRLKCKLQTDDGEVIPKFHPGRIYDEKLIHNCGPGRQHLSRLPQHKIKIKHYDKLTGFVAAKANLIYWIYGFTCTLKVSLRY